LKKTDSVRLSKDQLDVMAAAASPYARRLRSVDPDPRDLSHPRCWDETWLTSSMRTRHTAVSAERFAATVPGTTEPISRFYRLDARGLSNTLRAGTGAERGAFTSPRPIHPIHPRVISVREAARLHSFPDWFRFHGTKWNGFRQIGNAVTPLVGRAVADEIVRAMRLAPPKPLAAIELGNPESLQLTMTEAAEYFGAREDGLPGRRIRGRDVSPATRAKMKSAHAVT
jgi:DNA (cytosine-5)-methyltransferase 1